jgi:hypothetical protein
MLAAIASIALAGATPAPASFTADVTNPYFPLRPGQVTVLRGRDGDARFRERVRVTHRTRVIQGVRCRVVRDVVRRLDGTVAERTADYYASDDRGRVWYFGEDTATYRRDGTVESRDGTWRAGRDGAVRGVVMPAHPHPGQAYRQELLRGEAEDQAWIVQDSAVARTPVGTFRHVVRSFEWSRLEPAVVSVKLYAPGVGIVSEHDVAGGEESFVLVARH